jgi:hypothetical protein
MRPAAFTYDARPPKSVTKSTVDTWKKSGPSRLEHCRFFYLKDGRCITVRVSFHHLKRKSGPGLSSQDNTRQCTMMLLEASNFILILQGLYLALHTLMGTSRRVSKTCFPQVLLQSQPGGSLPVPTSTLSHYSSTVSRSNLRQTNRLDQRLGIESSRGCASTLVS